jgi:hypothetical protein
MNEHDQTVLLPATVEELAAMERDEAGGQARRRPMAVAAVATSVLLISTAGWVAVSRSSASQPPAVAPLESRPAVPYIDGFGPNTASASGAAPPISRGSPRPVTSRPAPSASPTPGEPSPDAPVAPLVVESTLLSRGRPATSSSVESNSDNYRAGRAVDGNIDTRWSSSFDDNQWITIDLGQDRRVTRVQLRWEVAYARRYRVQVSSDGGSWRTVADVDNGDGGIDEQPLNVDARYVRILCDRRATEWGFSLWEFEVYGY